MQTKYTSRSNPRTALMLCIACACATAFAAAPAPAPSDNTPLAYAPIEQPPERQRMLDLLGIKQTRRGLQSNGGSPMSANNAESKVDEWPPAIQEVLPKPRPPHASTLLPDMMTFKDGSKVKTVADWEKRRLEIFEDFDREIYGRVPKDVPAVTWTVQSNEIVGNVRTKRVLGHVDNSAYPQITVDIQLTVSTPANATGPVPIMMEWGGGFGGAGAGGARGGGRGRGGAGGAPGGAAPAAPAPGPGAQLNSPADLFNQFLAEAQAPTSEFHEIAAPGGPAGGGAGGGAGRGGGRAGGAGGRGGGGPSYTQQLLAHGWGYASLNQGSIQGQDLLTGIIGLTSKGQGRKPDEWGAERAWGWGASRAMDYFETDKDIDAKSAGIEGHSFLGKATLVSMVYEPRFSNAFVSSSGEGGAKIWRRNLGESTESVAGTSEYYWMAGNFIRYAGPLTADDMPVDSHEFIGLIAPRTVFISSGAGGDNWQDPRGMFLGTLAAGPAWEIYGKKALTDAQDQKVTEMPPVRTPLINGDLAFRQHEQGHVDTPNWPTFIEFASKHWKTYPPAEGVAPPATAPAAP